MRSEDYNAALGTREGDVVSVCVSSERQDITQHCRHSVPVLEVVEFLSSSFEEHLLLGLGNGRVVLPGSLPHGQRFQKKRSSSSVHDCYISVSVATTRKEEVLGGF